jgi:hypothetical protein
LDFVAAPNNNSSGILLRRSYTEIPLQTAVAKSVGTLTMGTTNQTIRKSVDNRMSSPHIP